MNVLMLAGKKYNFDKLLAGVNSYPRVQLEDKDLHPIGCKEGDMSFRIESPIASPKLLAFKYQGRFLILHPDQVFVETSLGNGTPVYIVSTPALKKVRLVDTHEKHAEAEAVPAESLNDAKPFVKRFDHRNESRSFSNRKPGFDRRK